MNDLFTQESKHELVAFYDECQRLTKFKDHGYGRYGEARAADCDLAIRYGGFERVALPKPKIFQNGAENLASFNFLYNREGKPLDLAYIIAPDTRVPNYTTNLADALEIAIAVGLTHIPVPSCCGWSGTREMAKWIAGMAT